MRAHVTPAYPYRVLIVDDEERWVQPMLASLTLAAREGGITKLEIETAKFADQARRHMASSHYHVVSLDMRLPERANEAVSVETGVSLAKEFPYLGFPKYLIYSQTLVQPPRAEGFERSDAVLRLQADTYAKSDGSNVAMQDGAPVLSAREWASCVLASLDPLQRALPPRSNTGDRPLTVMGVLLAKGPALMPPPLAREVARLADAWGAGGAGHDRIVALVRLTAQWAIGQGATLCAVDGVAAVLPETDSWPAALEALRAMQPALTGWNWSRYLRDEVIDAFEALSALTAPDLAQSMTLLQHALDVCVYWVRHPLCAAPRFSRDGWTAQPLAGPSGARRRKLLPEAQDFDRAEGSAEAWQSVWRLRGDNPVPEVVPWSPVLRRNELFDGRWWLCVHRDGGDSPGPLWLDMDAT